MRKILFFLKTVNYKLLLISLYKFTNTAILAFIAYFLFQIYEKLPKTYTINELKEIAHEDREKEDQRKEEREDETKWREKGMVIILP